MLKLDRLVVAGVDFPHAANNGSDCRCVFQISSLRFTWGLAFPVTLPLTALSTAECISTSVKSDNFELHCFLSLLLLSKVILRGEIYLKFHEKDNSFLPLFFFTIEKRVAGL